MEQILNQCNILVQVKAKKPMPFSAHPGNSGFQPSALPAFSSVSAQGNLALGAPMSCCNAGRHFYSFLLPHLTLTSKNPSPDRKMRYLPSQHANVNLLWGLRNRGVFICLDNFCRILFPGLWLKNPPNKQTKRHKNIQSNKTSAESFSGV